MKKVFFNELKTEFLHHRTFAILWWLLVLLDLGIQLHWWPGDSPIRYYVQYGIWIGLALFPTIQFSEISPDRVASIRIRPISDRLRILARVTFLILAVGLPWWIHEIVYLAQAADASAKFIIQAVMERILICLVYWTSFGLLAWCSKSVRIACLSGIAITLISIEIFESVPPLFRTNYDSQITASFHPIVWLSVIFTIALTWWLGWLWRRSSGGQPWKQWVPFLLICSLASPIFQTFRMSVQSVALMRSSSSEAMEQIASNATFSLSPEHTHYQKDSNNEASWDLQIRSEGLPPGMIARARSAKGKWSWPDFVAEFPETHSQNLGSNTPSEHRCMLNKITATVGITPLMYSLLHGKPGIALKCPPNISAKMPEATPDTATTHCELEILEFGELVELPIDDTWHTFGSFGQARFVNWSKDSDRLGFTFEYHPNLLFFNFKNGVLPRQTLGLWNPNTNEWIDIGVIDRRYGKNINELFSASPTIGHHIYIYESDTTANIVDLKGWLEDARIFLIEEKYIGRLKSTLTDRDITFPKIPTRSRVLARKMSPQQVKDISNDLQNPPMNPTEMGFRKWLYKISLATGIGGLPWWETGDAFRVTSISEPHRPILREMVTLNRDLDRVFHTVWNEADRDWLFKLETESVRERSRHYIIKDAEKNGRLNDRPDLVKTIIEKLGKRSPKEVISLAEGFKLEGIERLKFDNELSLELWNTRGKVNYSQKEQFPDVWKKYENRNRVIWDREKWTLPFTVSARNCFTQIWSKGQQLSRLTGDAEPLKDVCRVIGQGVMRDPLDDRYITQTWKQIAETLNQPATVIHTDPENRASLARKWLESEWEFEPETLTYRIIQP